MAEPTNTKPEEPSEELPDVDEDSVGKLSEEVRRTAYDVRLFTDNRPDKEIICRKTQSGWQQSLWLKRLRQGH